MNKPKKDSGTVVKEKFILVVPIYLTKLEGGSEELYAAEAIRCGDVPNAEGWQPLYTIYWKNKKKANWKLPDKICDYGMKYNIKTGQFIES